MSERFEVSIVCGSELTPEHLRMMGRLQGADPRLASPYFSAEFVALISSHRDDVRVGFVRRGDSIVGYLAFQVAEDGYGEPLAHPCSDFHGVVAAPGTLTEGEQLIRACGLQSWRFHHLLAHQELFRSSHAVTFPSPYLDLGGGFEDYAQQRRDVGTRQIRQIEASRRKLEAECGEVRFVARTVDADLFTQLRAWKEDRFLRRGWKTLPPWVWSMLQALIRTETAAFAGMLSALHAGSELIAAHLGMRSRTTWHYWYPAFDHRFARYQPGLILLLEMARHASDLGVTRIDLGAGDELYKIRLANASELLARGRVNVRCP